MSAINEVDEIFKVTVAASQQVAKYFEGKVVSPVRISYVAGG